METKIEITGKIFQRRVKKACKQCSRSHLSCDEVRPCKRCIQRGISENCEDQIGKRRGRRRKIKEPNDQNFIKTGQDLMTTNTPNLKFSKLTPNEFSKQVQEDPNFLISFDLPEELQYSLVFQKQIFQEENDVGFFPKLEDTNNHLLQTCTPLESEKIITNIAEIRRFIKSMFIIKYGQHQIVHKSWTNYWKGNFHKKKIELCISAYLQFSMLNQTPLIIWDRIGRVLFMSKEYQVITSWNPVLPSEAHLIFKEMTPGSYREFVYLYNNFIMCHLQNQLTLQWFMFNGGIKDHSKKEHFVNGTFNTAIQFDEFGIPLIFIGTFLPTEVQTH